MKRYYCTHFDINYLPHFKALANSLKKVSPESEIFAFCMDDISYENLVSNKPQNVNLIHFSILERTFSQLLEAKKNRTKVEYFYTCSPAICNYVLNFIDNINEVTYLDADLFFYSSPEPIFIELKDSSVGIIDHKFTFWTKRNIIYGRFNVGWITFRKDLQALSCLNDWTNNCIEWCYQRLENDKYADQKYLNNWQRDYVGVQVIENTGANLAIWNIGNYNLSMRNGVVYVDDNKLIFYHFANLKQIDMNSYKSGLSRVFVKTSDLIKSYIYVPYIMELSKYIEVNNKIIPKSDIHSSGFGILLRKVSRTISEWLFPDIIKC